MEKDNLFDELERNIQFIYCKHAQYKVTTGYWMPALDIYELADKVVAVIELPGVCNEDLNITLDGDLLTIEGNRPDPALPDVLYRRQIEINHGPFRRRMKLCCHVEKSEIEASLKNGYLYITVPKR